MSDRTAKPWAKPLGMKNWRPIFPVSGERLSVSGLPSVSGEGLAVSGDASVSGEGLAVSELFANCFAMRSPSGSRPQRRHSMC